MLSTVDNVDDVGNAVLQQSRLFLLSFAMIKSRPKASLPRHLCARVLACFGRASAAAQLEAEQLLPSHVTPALTFQCQFASALHLPARAHLYRKEQQCLPQCFESGLAALQILQVRDHTDAALATAQRLTH